MTVRLSCNDYAWPVLSHPTVLSIIRDLGFDGVDIGLFADATHVMLSSVLPDPVARADELRTQVQQAGLEVADVFLTSSMELERLAPTSRVGNDVEDLRAIFRATVDFAAELGSPGVTPVSYTHLLIISGGVNVYPAEVEHVLSNAPGAREVVVFGRPDERWGQRVCAAVTGDVDADDLRALASARLAPFKRPKEFHVVEEIPRRGLSKVRRSTLAADLGLEPSDDGEPEAE